MARNLQISDKYPEVPKMRRGKLPMLVVGLDYDKIGDLIYPKLFQPGQYRKYSFDCPVCYRYCFVPATRKREPDWMELTRENKRTRFQAWEGVVRCPWCGMTMTLDAIPKDWVWDAPAFIPEKEITKIAWFDKAKNQPAIVETETAHIDFMSAAAGRETFQGPSWAEVWIDEELGDDAGGVWAEIVRGTTDMDGRIIMSYTPLARQEVAIDLHDRHKAGDPDVFEATIGLVHNHHISLKSRTSVAKTWPREQWRCRIRGEFFAFEGLVYPEFDRDVHCIKRFDICSEENRGHYTFYRSIDPGLNVTAVNWFAVDRDDNFVITDELHLESGNLKALADSIRDIDAGREIEDTTIDPSDQKSLSCREGLRVVLWRDYGIRTHSNFSRDVNQGIFRVKETLIKREGKDRPQFHIFDDLEYTIREITRYRVGDKKANIDRSGKPVKKNDHHVDEIRYRIMAGLRFRGASGGDVGFEGETPAMRFYRKHELPLKLKERRLQEAAL